MTLRERIGGAIAARLPVWIAAAVAAVAAALGVLSGGSVKPTTEPGDRRLSITADPEEPIVYEGLPYELHAVGERHADGRAIPTRRIGYYVDPVGLNTIRPATTPDAVSAAMREAWSSWASGLDIDPVQVERREDATVIHQFATIDGRGNTLAWSMLSDGSGRQLAQRYDTGEVWTMGGPATGQVSLPAVAAHEIGHALGLDHDGPDAASVLRPYYNSVHTRPTARDFTRAVAIGYRRRPDLPEPGDAMSVIRGTLSIRTSEVVELLKGAGFEVKPPAKSK